MTEDPEMGQLVDHDGLERFGRREHQPPAEHQPTLTGGAAPPAARVAQADRRPADVERGRVVGDRRVDREPGLVAQPALEDPIDPVRVARRQGDAELEPVGRHDPGDGGAAGRRRGDPQPMELPRNRIAAPSVSPPRAASSAAWRARRSRCRAIQASRSRRNVSIRRSGWAQPRRVAAGR